MYFLSLVALPLMICAVALFSVKDKRIPLGVAVVMLVLVAIICGVMFGFGPESASADTEIWNGRIQQRWYQDVHCRHSYECNCYTTTDSKGNSTQHCSTCYEHSYDRDWMAKTTNGEEFDFPSPSRQGLDMPDRWAKVFPGEATAVEHLFTNYFRLATHNVVANFEDGIPNAGVPDYPTGFDYYRVNKLVDTEGLLNAQDAYNWRWLLNEINADLGAKKQVNVIVMLTKWADVRYAFNVNKAWLGGKKNDVVLLIGTGTDHKINWVRVLSWSTDPGIKITLRDRVAAAGSLDNRDEIAKAIREEVTTKFQRVHMKDQKYLRDAWRPSTGTTLMLQIFLTMFSLVGVILGPNMIEDYDWR